MSKLCPHCKSKKVGSFNDTVMCCMTCHRVFGKSQLINATVFDTITASMEVLAEKLVYPVSYHWEMEFRYTSNLIPGHKRFDTKEEAIAATVAKLKEVCNA